MYVRSLVSLGRGFFFSITAKRDLFTGISSDIVVHKLSSVGIEKHCNDVKYFPGKNRFCLLRHCLTASTLENQNAILSQRKLMVIKYSLVYAGRSHCLQRENRRGLWLRLHFLLVLSCILLHLPSNYSDSKAGLEQAFSLTAVLEFTASPGVPKASTLLCLTTMRKMLLVGAGYGENCSSREKLPNSIMIFIMFPF